MSSLPKLQLLILNLAILLASILAVEAAPSSPLAQAIASYNSGKYSQALGQFQDLSHTEPTNAVVHYYLALCYQHLQQFEASIKEYQWVVTNSPYPALKANAQTGLQQLTHLKPSRSFSGSGLSSNAPYGTRPKVLDFYADWCGPCKQMEPIMREVESKYRAKVDFQKLDLDDPANEALVRKHNVRAIPYLVVLDGSGKVVSTVRGSHGKEDVEAAISKALTP